MASSIEAAGLNESAANNMQMQNFYGQNQEVYYSLSHILDAAIQRTYHQLMIMVDMFPGTPDKEKKIKIIAYACKTRQLFMRIYALVKFIRTAHINVSNILSFLDQQSFIFVDTADFLYNLAKVKLVNARLPSYSILTAVDVLTLGTYQRLPSCIKERILPPEKMSDEEKARTLETLNRIIQCRLALCELPQQLKNFKIENGCVRFSVRDEFEAKLTLISDDFRMPWRLLKLKILVKDANDPNRALVNKFQIHHIHNIVQMKLNENNRPLVDLYKSLHFFAHSLQLEVLLDQMRVLNSLTMDRFFKISEYLNWRRLTVKYWLDYSKTEYEFKFTVYVSENSDYLQTSHHPPLHWRDHKNIDTIFKNGELLIKTLVHQIIKFRSKKRLIEIQTAFDKIPYCRTTLIEEKPALKVQFFISKFQNEAVWISIDYYTGLVQVFFPHSTSNPTLRSSIEAAFNGDLKKIDSALLNLRIWLLLKRCETLIKTHGFKCFDELPIMSISDNQLALVYSKLEKNRLFIELRKQDKIYIMVTIRTKEDVISQKEDLFWHESSDYFMNENSFSFNYYILNIAKCKFDGELDPKQPFLKLMSISHYKKNSIFVMRNTNNKNRIGSRQIEDENNPCILEFINMIYHIEERLPYLTLMGVLSKQNLVTQNIQMNPEMLQMLSLSLMSVPQTYEGALLTGEQAQLERVSRELNTQLISFTIRQRGFKDYTNTLIPINLNSVLKQAVFGMNARLMFTIEFVIAHSRLFDLPETCELTNKSEVDLDSVMEVETPAQNNLPVKSNENQHSFMSYHSTLEAPSLESLYTSIRSEWISMCRMYALLKEVSKVLRNTDNSKVSELSKQMRVKTMNLKKIVIRYGPSLAYTVQFQWSKEAKSYDIQLGVDSLTTARAGQVDAPFVNYHNLFLNEIRKYFAANQSVINLVQLLNYTCVSVFGLARLSNLPKFYQKAPFNLQANLNSLQPFCGFTLVICSLTHFRLVYYSKYCLDVHIKTNGLVSIRDGSFGLTDINSAMEELCPIQFLRAFLDMFLDENVQELLRRRASLVEDDNPDSPSAANNNTAAQQHQHQNPQSQQQYNQQQQQNSGPGSQQQHVFVPPTSPAVRAGAGNVPTPSPVHPSYFAPSPSSAAALASAPGSNAPPSVAQSPGGGGGGGGGGSSNTAGNTNSGALFGNFGSPAIPHSSPAPGSVGPIIPPNQQSQGSSQQQSQSQQPHSQQPASHPHMIQSPSGFMSPATSAQQQNYSTQSPANFSELSLQSPIQSMSIKSPFVGPSPSTNIPSVPPPTSTMGGATGGTSSSTAAATHYGRGGGGDNNQENDHTATATSSRARSSQQLSNLASVSTSSILYNYHQYKKCHSASIPIYLSEAGFLKIITCQPLPNSETSICPLECFLASYHLKRLLIKAFQNDPTNFQLKNAEANIYKTYHVEMQISNEITPNYNAFSISFSPISSGAASGDLPVDKIQSYFATKILTPPFRSSAAMSFFNLISTHDAKMLKEFAQIMDYEMNPHVYKTPWRVKYCWTIPYSYVVKSEKPNLVQFYQTSQFGFLRKDKYYYFILNFINQQRPTFLNYNPTSPFNNQNSVANIMLLMCFDSASASFQYEICRPFPENLVLRAYENYISTLVNSAKQKDNSLITIINELLYGLPPFLR